MNNRKLYQRAILAIGAVSLFPTAESIAAVAYNVADLGTLGGTYSLPFGINESDEVTGLSYGVDNAINQTFFSSATGTAQPLDILLGGSYSQGMDINNFHEITGQASLSGNSAYHAFVWQGSQAIDLGTLDPINGSGFSLGASINDKQQIAGYANVNGRTEVHAVIWIKNTSAWQISDLGTLDQASGTGVSKATGINEMDQVTGISTLPGSAEQHAVIWAKETTGWTSVDLGTLGGTYSSGFAINDNGEVTGSSTTAADAEHHAFVAQASTGQPTMTDLKTLGGTFSEGYSINMAGDIVGYSTTAGDRQQVAFLWQNGVGMQDLNTLIDPASGWTLLEAHAINDKGNIAGIGLLNGEKHAFLLTKQGGDSTPPLVSYLISPASPSASGWYLIPPQLAWTVTDPESTISVKTGCASVAAIADTTSAGVSFTCNATSDGGTSQTVSTPVIKVDTVPPALANVPVSFTEQATSLTTTIVNYALPTASDGGSGINPTGMACLPASGSDFAMGATTVNCNVQDNAGNGSGASFVVTVADLIPPAFTSCPANVTLLEGQTLPQPLATDNLSSLVISGDPGILPPGITSVTWTATDQAGLSATCPQQVTVEAATVAETINVTRAECKVINATSGEWGSQGSTSLRTNNSLQLYASAKAPTDPGGNSLGSVVPDSKGQWKFQSKPGPSCVTQISLRSAAGTTANNIPVAVR
ncbi:MAG: HYR domain-containing protein [Gammaproteobacteria bacterium]